MSWNKFKYIYLLLFFIFISSGAISFYWMISSEPQQKPQIPTVQQPEEKIFRINNDTEVIFQEKYKICQKYGLDCAAVIKKVSVSERTKLNGLTIEELKQLYAYENYCIEKTEENKVIITQLADGLCPNHKKIWHLGPNNSGDYVAVYYGPSEVKNEGGIFKVTEIPINQLPLEYQEKIKNYKLEFYQEEELIATLDSFSEFLD